MPKRHLILVGKTATDKAEVASSTLEELGIRESDTIVVTGPTGVYILAAAEGDMGPAQIRLPTRQAFGMKEGERLMVQPSEEPAPPPPPPGPQARGPAAQTATKGTPVQVEWDPIPAEDFEEIAGLGPVKARIEQALFYLTHPEWFLIRKSLPPRVFLFFGPYGCGKTMLAKGMASRLAMNSAGGCKLDVKMKVIKSTDVKDPYLGMSARHIQQYLSAAREAADDGSTVLFIFDEIDSLVGNRSDGAIHEEYRDVINTVIQEVQGVKELETEARIRRLWKDSHVEALRKHMASVVREQGKKNKMGDIFLPEKDWNAEVKKEMQVLRKRVIDEGGVSTVIIVGTTNDPTRVDEAFLSRAGDNVFFVPRPSGAAIEQMLAQYLDAAFVELSDAERKALARSAYAAGLTGRDISLAWLQPLAQATPGSLRILAYQSICAQQPKPQVGTEWEYGLYKRLQARGHLFMAEQVGEYLADVEKVRGTSAEVRGHEGDTGEAPAASGNGRANGHAADEVKGQ